MNTDKKWLWLSVSILAIAWLSCGGAHAAFVTDWSAPDVVSVANGVNTNIDGSRDITNVWYRNQNGTNFFRMDLRSVPLDLGGHKAPDYMIHIDSVAGGATYGTNGVNDTQQSDYIAAGLVGIDEIVDAHYRDFFPSIGVLNHKHVFSPGANPPHNFTLSILQPVGGIFQNSENGGATLEWIIPAFLLNTNTFRFYAASQDIFSGTTWDLVGPIYTPPTAQITAIQVGTNISLTCTGTNTWVPVPWIATNLAAAGAWTNIGVFSSTYPSLSEGVYTVSFDLPTNGPNPNFFKIISTSTQQ